MDARKKIAVGLFVGGTLLLFALGLFLIGDSTQLFTKSFDIEADFGKVTGLAVGTKVRVAGMDGGAVTSIQIPPDPGAKFRVRFRVVEKLHSLVRQDSVATIQTDGLLGNKFLEVDAGSSTAVRAVNGSTIQSKEPFDFGDLMDQMSGTVKALAAAMRHRGSSDEVRRTHQRCRGIGEPTDQNRHARRQKHPCIIQQDLRRHP